MGLNCIHQFFCNNSKTSKNLFITSEIMVWFQEESVSGKANQTDFFVMLTLYDFFAIQNRVM